MAMRETILNERQQEEKEKIELQEMGEKKRPNKRKGSHVESRTHDTRIVILAYYKSAIGYLIGIESDQIPTWVGIETIFNRSVMPICCC